MNETARTQRVVLVTGPSGAGRATTLSVLEDFGFEAIDNIPLSLIPRLVEGPFAPARPIALGIDTRNRDFGGPALLALLDALTADEGIAMELLYLDCSVDVLERRYSETRRRHPMAPDGTPRDGILRELDMLEPVRPRADIVIDTSALTVHDLRASLEPWFGSTTGQRMAITVQSFSYKQGLPQGLDMAFDCRFLNNPHWEPALRDHTGLDADVAAFVAADPRYAPFVARLMALIEFVLPEAEAEGKAHLSLGLGCTGGRHRSVALAERVGKLLRERDWTVAVRHRELERRGVFVAGSTGGMRA